MLNRTAFARLSSDCRSGLLARLGISLALVTGLFSLGTWPAGAATTCTTTLTGMVSGPVVVPSGAICTLNGATVSGNVLVQPGGTFHATDTTINGSLTSDNATTNNGVCRGTITGSVSITNSRPNSDWDLLGGGSIIGFVFPCTSAGALHIGGSVRRSGNRGDTDLAFATIAGSVTTTDNVPPSGDTVDIDGNTIGGSLFCSGNVPAPTNSGFPNTVAGARSGQTCASPTF